MVTVSVKEMLMDSETTHGLYFLSITATTERGTVTWIDFLTTMTLPLTAERPVSGLVNHHGGWRSGWADNFVAGNR